MLRRLNRRPIAIWSSTASQLFTTHRLESTWVHHKPSPSAPREVPTPIILLSASKWSLEGKAEETLSSFVSHFTSRGWSVSSLDLEPNDLPKDDSQKILSALESELISQLSRRHESSPFPPLIIAKNLATLIAETYVSSNALSGMVLLDPPISPEVASSKESSLGRLPTPLPPFTYEATFPCMVAWSAERAKGLAFWDAHRIEHLLEDEADASLDRKIVNLEDETESHGAGPHEVRMWAEDSGMLQEYGNEFEVEEKVAEQKDEKDEYELVEDGEDIEKDEKRQQKKVVFPTWYSEGKYSRNPSKSLKEPLLLDSSDILESFIRGSGPGGQAINKLSTCVQLKHKPTGIVMRCQESRSRELNRELARRKLSQELERLVFGDRDSVLGKKAQRERRKKTAKRRKRKRKDNVEEK